MSVQRIASRYAKSLIDLAQEQNKLDRVMEDVKVFQNAMKNRDLMLMLKSPIVNGGKKAEVIKALFGDQFDEMTLAFTNIIIKKGREPQLSEIVNEFMEQYNSLKKMSTVKLTTATKLDEEALAKIKAELLKSTATKDNVEVVTAVDAKLIGGFVIEFGDKLYDASVAHKLEKLRKELLTSN